MTPKTEGSIMKHKTDYPEINYQTVTYWRKKKLVQRMGKQLPDYGQIRIIMEAMIITLLNS